MGCHAGAICGELRCRTVTEPYQFFGESPEKRGISQLRWCSLASSSFFSLAKDITQTKKVLHSIALCSKGWHLKKKSYHEMFNFENWFLCQFSSNTRFSFGGGSLNTPKIGKCKKEFTNINLRGFKAQKTWRGCLSRIKRVSKFSFLYMLWYLLS